METETTKAPASEKTKIVVIAEDLITVPQAAKELGVHHTTIYRWIQKGKLHPLRLGGQVFLTIGGVRAIKEGMKNNQAIGVKLAA